MWPAVPSVSCGTTSAAIENGANEGGAWVDLGVAHRARIEDHQSVLDAGDHRGLALPEASKKGVGAILARVEGAHRARKLDGREGSSARAPGGAPDRRARTDRGRQAFRASGELGLAR